ncbi:hypothetical protein P43SY_001982 [Pythium insidiosum]|uniref:Uncharacterized protein n=1 Tax=Pythium insidiosum TaxID=114742 RepID=A0AAD5QAH2_PYTIN|nr:hypothetical protein P43SY_001982 [Pythium insidiosum]
MTDAEPSKPPLDSPALDRLHGERARGIDDYLARHHVLDVFSAYLRRLATSFDETRRVPRNPYPSLLRHVRLAELVPYEQLLPPPDRAPAEARALQTIDAPRVVDSTLQAKARLLPSHLQLVAIASTSFAVFRGVAERMPRTSDWAQALVALKERLPRPATAAIVEQDEGFTVHSVSALVGPQSFLLRHQETTSAMSVELESHIVVRGEHLELAMAAFARQLVRRLRQETDGTLVRQPILRVIGERNEATTWTPEKLQNHHAPFVAAVKAALAAAANSGSHIEFLLSAWRLSSSSAKNALPSIIATDTRSVSVAIAMSASSKEQKAAPTKAMNIPRDAWQISDRIELLSAMRQGLLDSPELSTSCGFLFRSFALQLLREALEIHEVIKLVTDLSDPLPELLESHLEHLKTRLESVVEGASLGAESSALSGLAPLLRSLLLSIPSPRDGGPDDLVAALSRLFDAMVLLAGPLLQDLASLRRPSDDESAVVDLRSDIAVALEWRQYPPTIAAECVLAQWLADYRLDVAMESAVVNTVACGLPPTPFVAMSRHLRVFALLLDRPLSMGLDADCIAHRSVIVEHIFIEGAELEEAITMYADAVRREVQRLIELSLPVWDAELSPPTTVQIIGPSGDVEDSDISLQSLAAFEQLIAEKTTTKRLIGVSLERLAASVNKSPLLCDVSKYFRLAASVNKSPLLCDVSKYFVLHFATPSTPRLDRHTSNEAWTSYLSDVIRFHLQHFGVFPASSATAAASIFTASTAAPAREAWSHSMWRRLPMKRHDQLHMLELDLAVGGDDNGRPSMPRWLCHATTPTLLPLRRLDDMPLAVAMGYAAALPRAPQDWSDAAIDALARRLAMQLRIIRAALQHDVWADTILPSTNQTSVASNASCSTRLT